MTEWYVVGGAVRDLLLGRPVHDIDISFAGGEESFLQRFPQARKTGNGLDIWLVGPAEFTELAGGRSEGGEVAGRSAVEADLHSRDLTINAAAMDSEGRLFCHPRFMDDMRERVLRLASDRALEQDPLRVFRLARFAAELPDFSVAPETLEAMRAFAREQRERFDELPRERVGRELMKAFSAPRPSRFLTVLHEADCLSPWFQEFSPAAEIPAGPSPWHDNSVLEHTMEVMDRCAGHPLAVWMALCHDIGKVRTEASMLPHHYGHELKGVDLVKELGRRFCLPSRWIRAGVVGTLLHMKGGMYGALRSGTRRDMLCQLRDAHLGHEFWLLTGADGGWDWEPMAERDLKAMQKVHLPREWCDRGEESGKRLRAMQCEAISRLPRLQPERAANAGDTPVPAYMKEQGQH
jgi:tRNA nucleotidyltransferase (CCA-adding enzyme)